MFSQAWAIFKGKFKEGDKAEPATWKTRLRCALNKSPDFEEVTDRSQLDISEPYKVYRIVPEEEQKCTCVLFFFFFLLFQETLEIAQRQILMQICINRSSGTLQMTI